MTVSCRQFHWNFLVSRVMPSGIILSIRSDKPISRQILCVQAPHAHTSVITSHQKSAATVQWTNTSEVMGDSISKIIFKLQHSQYCLDQIEFKLGVRQAFWPSREKEYSHLKTAIIVKQWTFEKVQCSCCQYGSLSKTCCCSA